MVVSSKRASATSGRIQGPGVTGRSDKEGASSDEVARKTASKVDSISLPPVRLPQKLQDAVGRVLLSEINAPGVVVFHRWSLAFHSGSQQSSSPTLCSHKPHHLNAGQLTV